MNYDRMKLWVEALRSGEYQQGKTLLRVEDNFCCLGVACEVAIKNGVNINVIQTDRYFSYNDATHSLPQAAMEFFGIKDNFGSFRENALSAENDRGTSFQEIANIIEENWEIL